MDTHSRRRGASAGPGALLAAAVQVGLLLAAAAIPAGSQQVSDSSFTLPTLDPAFAPGTGPRILLDEAHHNFHTLEGRYRAFATLLRADGYRIMALRQAIDRGALAGARVLVIANALNARNASPGAWVLPTPSAFTPEEIHAVRAWVEEGGALLLVADHMPFPGAAGDLAAAFGFEWLNGFAVEGSAENVRRPIVFRRSDGSLTEAPLGVSSPVDSVATFTGSAFRPPPAAQSLLTFRRDVFSLQPDTAWVFGDRTPRIPVGGWSQGAVLPVGRGRVAVFGEAAMFSAQVQRRARGSVPMGMNAPEAGGNARFLLDVMHWLSGGNPGS